MAPGHSSWDDWTHYTKYMEDIDLKDDFVDESRRVQNEKIALIFVGMLAVFLVLIVIGRICRTCKNGAITYTREVGTGPPTTNQMQGSRRPALANLFVSHPTLHAVSNDTTPSQMPSAPPEGDCRHDQSSPPPFEHPPSYTEAVLQSPYGNGMTVKFPEKVS